MTITHEADGTATVPHESFNITITFSAPVDDFTFSDIRITNGTGSNFVGGTRSVSVFTFDLAPLDNHEGTVGILVPGGAGVGAGGGNTSKSYSFRVDTRGPRATRAAVNRKQLTIDFNEDLDETIVPDPDLFRVDVIDIDNDLERAQIDLVVVEEDSVTLTLAKTVRHDDLIELFYRNDDVTAVRDTVGNLAEEFGVEVPVRNETAQGAGSPDAPTGPRPRKSSAAR